MTVECVGGPYDGVTMRGWDFDPATPSATSIYVPLGHSVGHYRLEQRGNRWAYFWLQRPLDPPQWSFDLTWMEL